jgi:branched-chain amino acid transport system permease protein
MDRFLNAVLAGIAEGATYGLVALGIVLVYKATRVLNFAQAEIGTLCIYLLWEMTQLGVPVLIALPIALIAAALMGAATEIILRPLSEAPRLTVTVATLGIATALGFMQVVVFHLDPRTVPAVISGSKVLASINFSYGRVLSLAMAIGLGLGLYAFFKRTLFGLGVLASSQDQTALKLQGLPYNKVSMFTWSTGAVLTALAGILLAPTIGSLFPFFITQSVFLSALAGALVGGLTSLPGAFVGGLAIGIVENIAKFYVTSVPAPGFVAVFVAVVLILTFKPNGLLGAEA